MRYLFLHIMLLSALTAAAITVDVPRLRAPSFADGEVSGDSVIPTNRLDKLNVFRLEMTFDSTLSNNVQVAFGRDSLPQDGFLAAEETDWMVGWDCGEWFLRPQDLKAWHTFAPANPTDSVRRTLTAEIRVNRQGVPQSAVFSERGVGAIVFQGLSLSPVPDWLSPSLWSHLRVTVRGCGPTNETVSARFMTDGAVISIR